MIQVAESDRRGTPPRPSASVVLARDGQDGLEVFLLRRHERSRNLPATYVFPGGILRGDDYDAAWAEQFGPAISQAIGSRSDVPLEPKDAQAYATAALRELFEEAGVLLATPADGSAADALEERLAAERNRVNDGELSLPGLARQYGLVPRFDTLTPFSHWVTPDAAKYRYDTWFFVAAMPERQTALHCGVETTEGLWLRPPEVLASPERFPIIFPTQRHLHRIEQLSSVAELRRLAETKSIRRTQPSLDPAVSPDPWLPDDQLDTW